MRRKLIVSYILIGVVPAILIAVFFLLGALLMFFNFSSYLVQTEVRSLTEHVRLLATSAALEIQRSGAPDVAAILARLQRIAQSESPGFSAAVMPVNRSCAQALNSQVSSLRTPRALQT